MRQRLKTAGFTLVELLVVMAIAGVLISLAIPSYNYVTSANRVSGEINGLLGDMQFARIEAIREGSWVTICASSTGTSCLGTNNWASGWIVFMDPNNNQTVNAGETIWRVKPAFTGADTATADNATAAVTFNREGFAQIAAVTTVTIHNPTNTKAFTRCLAISLVGALNTELSGTGNCL
jgi:type IV fimbrial biogenesis protein FimT